jgi:hypothetical protein
MDSDFPAVMSGNDFLTSYLKKYGGGEQYSQTGTDIPTFSVGRDFAGGEGTGISPYFNEEVTASPGFGGQYQNLGEIAGTPSFDVNMPYIPGGQDYTGIPNANRDMMRRLQLKKLVNKGGQELFPLPKLPPA